MGNTPKNSEEVLSLLRDSLAADLLSDAVSDDEVDAELREAGADPDALGNRGAALAEMLLERRRLSWQDAARRKLKAMRQSEQSTAGRTLRPRQMLLQEINVLRDKWEQLGLTPSAAFRKRKPEDSTDEELAEFLEELRLLDRLRNDDKP